MERNHKPINIRAVVGLALLAFLVRIIYLQLQMGNPLFASPQLDELYHLQWAKEISAGYIGGDRAFFRAPLYSYLLGGLFSIIGPNLETTFLFYAATFLQHLGGVFACFLIYLLTRKLFKRDGLALGAMGIAIFYAPAIFFEGQLLDISLQAIFLPLILLLAIRAFEKVRLRDFFWLGLVGGLAAIARPAVLPWFVLVIVFSGWIAHDCIKVKKESKQHISEDDGEKESQRKQAIPLWQVWGVRMGLMIVGLALPILPVTLHNYSAEHAFVPIATYAGVNFWIGNNESADGFTSKTPERYFHFGRYEDSVSLFARRRAEEEKGQPLTSAEVQKFWFKQGISEIAQSPIRWLVLMGKKTVLFFNAFEIKNNKNIYTYQEFNPLLRALFLVFNFGLLMPFGVIGLIYGKHRSNIKAWRLSVLMLISLAVGVILFFINIRYRFPFAWLMIPFSAYGIDECIRRIKAMRPAKTGGTIDAKSTQSLFIVIIIFILSFAFININFFHIRQSNNLAEDYWAVAKGWQERGELEDAEMYYKKALEISPELSDAHNGLGEVYHSMNQLDDSAAAFEKALQTAGNDHWAAARALNNSGVVAEKQSRFEDAVKFYKQVIAIAPEHVLAWSNLGDAYRNLKNYEKAEISYRRSLELRPSNALAILGLAACDAQAGKHDEAFAGIQSFLEIPGPTGEQYLNDTPELQSLIDNQ